MSLEPGPYSPTASRKFWKKSGGGPKAPPYSLSKADMPVRQ